MQRTEDRRNRHMDAARRGPVREAYPRAVRIATAVTLLGACLSACERPPAAEPVVSYELANGFWYTGSGFETTTMYSVDGVLRAERPSRVDSVIDLEGGFVVPPFGEAHTHRPSSPERTLDAAATLLEAGVFYVMNHGSLARYREGFDSLVNRPESIDAVFAHALIASPQSHGVDLWRRLVARGVFPGVAEEELDGDAYFTLDSDEDLEDKWSAILETRPDFLKLMVEYSEEYDRRRDDPRYFGRSGLDPALIPQLVSLAHRAGLRVAAHIETADDFHAAVSAGVDIVAHLPGYDIPMQDDVARYRIDPLDAARAAEQNTIVVTTTLLSPDRAEEDSLRLARMEANHARNLRLLSDAGVTLAIGSDQFSKNSVDEALYLASLGVFDNATLLHMLSSLTPRVIFPDRRIGGLEDGAEASFLVLRGDPLERLAHIRDIALRFKDGRPLSAS